MEKNLADALLTNRYYKTWISGEPNRVFKRLKYHFSSLLSKYPTPRIDSYGRVYIWFALAKLEFWLDKGSRGRANNKLILSLSRHLNEPESKVKKILSNHHAHLKFTSLNDRASDRKSDYRKNLLDACQWENENEYLEKYRGTSKSAVYVTIHMGFTETMFLRIFSSTPEKEYSMIVHSINNQKAFENTQRFTRDIGLNVSMLETGDSKSITSAIRKLRKGVLSLGIYCDLPKSFGKSERISFLGSVAEIVVGPAKIAILGRVPIIPVFSFTRDHIPHIEMHAPIHTHRLADESVDDAAKRITQAIHKVSEMVIRQHPEQWMYLNKIQSFYPLSEEGI